MFPPKRLLSSLEDLRETLATISTCGHVFHEECLARWRTERAGCPLCKVPFRGSHVVKLFFEIGEGCSLPHSQHTIDDTLDLDGIEEEALRRMVAEERSLYTQRVSELSRQLQTQNERFVEVGEHMRLLSEENSSLRREMEVARRQLQEERVQFKNKQGDLLSTISTLHANFSSSKEAVDRMKKKHEHDVRRLDHINEENRLDALKWRSMVAVRKGDAALLHAAMKDLGVPLTKQSEEGESNRTDTRHLRAVVQASKDLILHMELDYRALKKKLNTIQNEKKRLEEEFPKRYRQKESVPQTPSSCNKRIEATKDEGEEDVVELRIVREPLTRPLSLSSPPSSPSSSFGRESSHFLTRAAASIVPPPHRSTLQSRGVYIASGPDGKGGCCTIIRAPCARAPSSEGTPTTSQRRTGIKRSRPLAGQRQLDAFLSTK